MLSERDIRRQFSDPTGDAAFVRERHNGNSKLPSMQAEAFRLAGEQYPNIGSLTGKDMARIRVERRERGLAIRNIEEQIRTGESQTSDVGSILRRMQIEQFAARIVIDRFLGRRS